MIAGAGGVGLLEGGYKIRGLQCFGRGMTWWPSGLYIGLIKWLAVLLNCCSRSTLFGQLFIVQIITAELWAFKLHILKLIWAVVASYMYLWLTENERSILEVFSAHGVLVLICVSVSIHYRYCWMSCTREANFTQCLCGLTCIQPSVMMCALKICWANLVSWVLSALLKLHVQSETNKQRHLSRSFLWNTCRTCTEIFHKLCQMSIYLTGT